MKFWQNNRIDGAFEAPIDQVVTQFRTSTWWTADLDVESAVRLFLTDADGPVSAVWDDEADLAEVCARALAAGWTGRQVRGNRPSRDPSREVIGLEFAHAPSRAAS